MCALLEPGSRDASKQLVLKTRLMLVDLYQGTSVPFAESKIRQHMRTVHDFPLFVQSHYKHQDQNAYCSTVGCPYIVHIQREC